MPAAPKDDGTSTTLGQLVSANASASTSTFSSAQNGRRTADAARAGYEARPVDYQSSNLAQYQVPVFRPGEQSYVSQIGAPFVGEVFKSSPILTGRLGTNVSLGHSGTQLDNSFGFSLNLVHAYEPQNELVKDPANTQRVSEDLTIPRFVPKQLQGTRKVSGTTTVGQHIPPIRSAGFQPSQRPSPTFLGTAINRKANLAPSSSIPAQSKHSTGLVAEQGPIELHGRMSKPNPLHVAGDWKTIETFSKDRFANRNTDSIASDVTSASGDVVEVDTSGGGMSSIAARRTGSDVGSSIPPGVLQAEMSQQGPRAASMLPAEKVFPIQIGSELFRLSGASITSDAPSYFSQFFEDQLRQHEDGSVGVRTLYIDRDPVTFQDISRHLQGYHVQPRDGGHFVRLFADAQFYSLPRLISQLFDSEIFIQIGHQHFQVPRDIFSGPGDSPNFFSLGFGVFFSTPGEVFPGLDRKGLLRPPSILPPSVPNRSAQVFAELLQMLRGYPLHIRNEEHRAELLRDCRYFHLRGLEQKLILHDISYNLERGKSEIVIRLEDIRQSGISFVGDASPADRSPSGGWVNYARPFVDENSQELILEIGGDSTKIDFRSMRADFHGLAKARISSLFQVVANKMNLPTNAPLGLMMMSGGAATQPASPGNTPLSEDRVKIRIERDAHVILDGNQYDVDWAGLGVVDEIDEVDPMLLGTRASCDYEPPAPVSTGISSIAGRSAGEPFQGWPPPQNATQQITSPTSIRPPPRKRKRVGSLDDFGEWIVRRGQWRLKVQTSLDPARSDLEIVLIAVKLDALSGERGRNTQRAFLS